MIRLEINDRDDIVVASPTGPLSADDIAAFAAQLDDLEDAKEWIRT